MILLFSVSWQEHFLSCHPLTGPFCMRNRQSSAMWEDHAALRLLAFGPYSSTRMMLSVWCRKE